MASPHRLLIAYSCCTLWFWNTITSWGAVEAFTAAGPSDQKSFQARFSSGERIQRRRSTPPIAFAATVSRSDGDPVESSDPVDVVASDGSDVSAFRRIRTYCVKGISQRDGPLNEAVAQLLNSTSSLQAANDLIDIGAVWARMDVLSEEDMLSLYNDDDNVKSSSRALYADLQGLDDSAADTSVVEEEEEDEDEEGDDLDEYIAQMQNQRFRRILSPSWIEAGTDLRVYPNPRRFPACYEMTRENNLLYEDTTFLVVDKPPMLPTQPDSSNFLECCPGCVQNQMGPFEDITGRQIARPLLCHRVDACVGGCVVLSKDSNGQRVFHRLQRDRQLRKVYLAVTTRPVPLGLHLHWMWAPQSARGKVGGPPCQLVSLAPPESRRKARELWKRCTLEVVKCEPIEIDASANGDTVPGLPQNKVFYQSTIRLVTGRKHQVRAQLAALGCPIVGDTLYEPMSGLTLDRLADAEELMDRAMAQARVPTQPIGLQAHAILFGGIRAKARTPWWGNQILKEAPTQEN